MLKTSPQAKAFLTMENSFNARLEPPKSTTLDRDCTWITPVFTPCDAIVEHNLWALSGLIVAIGAINDNGQQIIGSGVMMAPGLCLTATHVLEGLDGLPLLSAFVDEKNMRIWIAGDHHAAQFRAEFVPFQIPQNTSSDVSLISCSPFSDFTDSEPFLFAPIELIVPKIGERLWAMGFREKSNDGHPMIGCFLSSGVVSELYLEGRGSHLKGPCVEVKMSVLGGMSGGPVFNAQGRIVGIISSGLDGQDNTGGPTYVSLVWPALLSKVHAPWPEKYWPDATANLQTNPIKGEAHVLGSARRAEDGAIRITFSEQSKKASLKSLMKAAVCEEEDDLSDVAYDLFGEGLEDEGVTHLKSLRGKSFAALVSDKLREEVGSLFECVGVNCYEGMEDLDVKSITDLEGGNLGVEATFNLRRVEMSVSSRLEGHEWWKDEIVAADFFYHEETSNDCVIYKIYIRPYFRIIFGMNAKSRSLEKARIIALSIPESRSDWRKNVTLS
jgi:hypothetical protein